ncbi:hypothetical protein ACQ5SK_00460 [Bradyrhizobium japonicum]
MTPFLSMARHLVQTGDGDFVLHLIVREEVPLAAHLAPLIDAGRVVVHRTSRTGRPELASLVGEAGAQTLVACCGPESMIDDFERVTAAWPAANVHVERFVAPRPVIDPEAKPFTLSLARTGIEIQVRAGQTMLAALQEGASISRPRAAVASVVPARSAGSRASRCTATESCHRMSASVISWCVSQDQMRIDWCSTSNVPAYQCTL